MDTTIDTTRDGKPRTPEVATEATKFSMRGLPLLAQGASYDWLASAENLWLAAKVYASGGENAFHTHTKEDHAFVVVQGKATFHIKKGTKVETVEARQFEGIMLPKGASYRFEADEAENLVLLRIGAAQRSDPGNRALQRFGAPAELKGTTYDDDGDIKNARDPKTGTPSQAIIPIPGKFFAEEN